MTRDSRLRLGAALITLAICAAVPAGAQEIAPLPTPNADKLAEAMRTLARDPRNVRALLDAGELSARLNDAAAAAGFFARAQALDPANPRVQAGQAMVMVRMERPGEALRLFAEAERHGLSLESYAADRGLAYDLVGAQPHAQREYRSAMRTSPGDETVRRYALSLGISGHSDEAMRILDPLLRRSDRAGWRARAFILAMNGDAAGADKIAASMMGGVGSALAPFFRRLPTLSASDKAFAVHFGELRKTTARLADAQLAPPLPRLAQEPGVALAAVDLPRRPAPTTTTRAEAAQPQTTDRRGSAARRGGARMPLARAAREDAAADTRGARARETRRQTELKAQQEREALAARQREAERIAAEQQAALKTQQEREATRLATEQQAARDAEAKRVAEAQARDRLVAEQAERDREVKRLAEAQRAADAQQLAEAQQSPVSQPPAPTDQPSPAEQPASAAATVSPAPAPGFATTSSTAEPTPPQPAPVQSAQTTPPAPRVGGEDNVIARIIAGITIPASELGVEPMPGHTSPVPVTPEPLAAAPAPVTMPPAAVKIEPPKPRPTPERARAEPPKPEAVKPAPRGKPDPKVATDPKTKAGEAKAGAKGPAAKPGTKGKPDPAKTEPARQWVQVAGGANVSDLPKSWRALVAKAPAEFKGRQAWTTPLRFTNRLLVGPFKTPAEAQTFVNAIGKKGLSAFAWTSEAGQKIEKLSAN